MGVLGQAGDEVVRDIKHKNYATLDQLRSVIQRALSKAQNQSQAKLDELSTRLLNLSVIQKTPALQNAINSATTKIKDKMKELRDDISEAEASTLGAQMAIDRAEDASIFLMRKDTKNAEKEVNKSVQKLQEVEQRL